MVYFVESFYINVGAGDCAIHLLVQVPPEKRQEFLICLSTAAAKRPVGSVIVNAILMDGGQNEAFVIGNIATTIKHIETMYGVDILKFDSIGISHWDGDHFRGSMQYLFNELEEEYKLVKPIANESITSFRRLKDGLGSTVFCPNLNWGLADNKVKLYEVTHNEGGQNFFRMDIMAGENDMSGDETVVKTGNLAKVRIGETAIGYDLFSGDGPNKSWRDLLSLHELISSTPVVATDPEFERPRFFCVGIDHKFAGGIVGTKTDANGSSMMCLIVWPQNHGTARITLYTGGDAEVEQENRLVDWLQKDAAVHYEIECIKLGHHGAATSTSQGLFKLNPKMFIISAGKVHGHPTYTTVTYLYAYCSGKGDEVYRPAIYATRSPKWLNPASLYDPNPDKDTALPPSRKKLSDILSTSGIRKTVNFNLHKLYKYNKKGNGGGVFMKTFSEKLVALDPHTDLTAAFISMNKYVTCSQFFFKKFKAIQDQQIPDGVVNPLMYNLPSITYTSDQQDWLNMASEAWYAANGTAIRTMRKNWNQYASPKKIPKREQKANFKDPAREVTYILVRASPDTAFDDRLKAFSISLKQGTTSIKVNKGGYKGQKEYQDWDFNEEDLNEEELEFIDKHFRKEVKAEKTNPEMDEERISDTHKIRWNSAAAEEDVERRMTRSMMKKKVPDMEQEPNKDAESSHAISFPKQFSAKMTQKVSLSGARGLHKKVPRAFALPDHQFSADMIQELPSSDARSINKKVPRAFLFSDHQLSADMIQDSPLSGARTLEETQLLSMTSQLDSTASNANLAPLVEYDDLNPIHLFLNDLKRLQLAPQLLSSYILDQDSSVSFAWFRHFISSQKILISGSIKPEQSITIDQVELRCQLTDLAGSQYALEFSTAQEARDAQFGKENADMVDKLGYNKHDASLIFALTKCDKLTLGAMMDIIEIIYPMWVKAIFGLVLLKPSTSSTPRSGIWYQPIQGQETTLRLEMDVDMNDGAAKPIIDFLKTHLGQIQIKNITVVGNKFSEAEVAMSPDGPLTVQTTSVAYIHTALSWDIDPKYKSLDLHSTISIHPDGFDLILQLPTGPDIFGSIFTWLAERMKHSGFSETISSELQESLSGALKQLGSISVILKYLSLSFASENDKLTLAGFDVKFEVPLGFGAPEGKRCVALAGLSWTPGCFEVSGEIWNSFAVKNHIPFSLNPNRELWLEMLKPNTENAIPYLSLPHIIPGHTLTDYPHGIPDEITEGRIAVRFEDDKNIILQISGTLQCGPQAPENPVPPISLDELQLSAIYNFKTKAFSFVFRGIIDLRLDEGASDDPDRDMELSVSVAHSSSMKSWQVDATASNVRFANIYRFFNKGSERGAVLDILEGISIPHLSVSYDYQKGQPSAFHMDGAINLGPLELDFTYIHKGDTWNLEAELKKRPESGPNEITVGQILEDITHEVSNLPPFLTGLSLPLNEIALKLTCSRGKTHSDHIVFALDLKMTSGFHLTFVQLKQFQKPGTQPTPEPKQPEASEPQTKRLIRFALTKLPPVKDIPLVEKLEQPFDQMGFLWLNGKLSRAEVAIMNTEVFPAGEELLFKDKFKSTKPEDVVLKSGCHFQISLKNDGRHEVVLDHVFHQKKSPSAAPPGPEKPSPDQPPHDEPHEKLSTDSDKPQPDPSTPTAGQSSSSKGSTHAPVKKKINNLSIDNMGLRMEQSTLSIILDASVTLGPISVSLLQFSLDVDLSKIKGIKDLQNLQVSFSIAGLAVQYSKPPTTIAGAIKKFEDSGGKGYAGGLSIVLSQWAFMAAGLYERITRDGQEYSTIFAFAKLEGPIAELEFVEIHGLTGGFGYNSKLRFPSISEVTKFPFVTISTGAQPETNDTKSQLLALTDTAGANGGWMTPENDSFWLAAGLGIKAFQMLDVQAVVAVDLSSNFRLGIFGEGLAIQPVGALPQNQFLVVDLGFSAVFDPTKGIFSVSGELTPRSFILSPSCHLTGGFALAYFFEGSGHDGDWVFSIGGYHPAYSVPSHYPVPQRLGISWSYDSSLTITGAAYFAITPQCCMGGGRLDAVYSSGRIRASFSAYADFLINYRPFQFQADVGVAVDVYATIGWGWLSQKIHLEVDAVVELHGPPLAGTAHLHMWFVSVSIRFGPDKTIVDKLSLESFLVMVKQAEDLQKAKAIPDFILRAKKGVVQDENPSMVVKQDQDWRVRGSALEFEIQSRVPIRNISCNAGKLNDNRPVYSKPMRLDKSLTSDMVIDITHENGTKPSFNQAPLKKNVPTAIWGQYDQHADPEKGSQALLQSDHSKALTEHIMGVNISSPEPHESNDGIPAFDPHRLSSVDVIDPPVIHNGERPSPGSIPADAPGTTAEERVKEVVSRWKQSDAKLRGDIMDQFVQFVNPLKEKGKASKLYEGIHAGARTPERYLNESREHLREAPMVC